MDTENKNELFSIRVSEEGMTHLLKIVRIIRVFFVLGIIVSFISLVRAVLGIIHERNYQSNFLEIFFSAYPFFSIAATVVFILQLIFYRRFSEKIKQAVSRTDEDSFNASFEDLVKGVAYGLSVCVFSLLFVVVDLIILIKFW